MRILITGGVGFIGSNLLNYLSRKKSVKKIIIVDNFSKTNLKNIDKKLEYQYFTSFSKYKQSRKKIDIIRTSISKYSTALVLTKNIDYVVHLAAESGVDVSINKPKEAFDVNVVSAFNWLEASKVNNVKCFLFASSCAVFGNASPPHSEDIPRKPISPYGSAKMTVESFCETYSNVYNISSVILRFSNAYGSYSNHKNSVISKFIKNILNNKTLVVNGTGSITRDFIHVEDICDAIYKSLVAKKNGNKTYHVATGKETSINQLIFLLKNIFGNYGKGNFKIKYVNERIGDIKKNYATNKKIKRELKWKNQVTLLQGLEKTVMWFINK